MPIITSNWPVVGTGPLIEGVRFVGGTVGVARICDIQSWGYDAIAQIRDDLAARELRNPFFAARETSVEIRPEHLTPDVADALAVVEAAHPVDAPYVRFPPVLARMRVDLEPRALVLSLGTPRVDFRAGGVDGAALSIRGTLRVRMVETADSHRERVDLSGLPPPFDPAEVVDVGPVTEDFSLFEVSITWEDRIRLEVRAADYEARPMFDVHRAERRVSSSASAFETFATILEELLDEVSGRLRSLALGPELSLGGGLLGTEALTGLGPFEAEVVTGPANTIGQSILSVCMLVRPGGRAGRSRVVAPFVGTRNFAYYTSIDIVRATALKNFARNSVNKEYSGGVLVPMVVDGEPATSRAETELSFRELAEVSMVVGLDEAPNAIRLQCRFRVLVTALFHPDGSRVEDLGELGVPAMSETALDVRPFAPPDDTHEISAASRFLTELTRRTVYAALRPTGSRWRLGNVTGEVSQAAAAMVTRGDLVGVS